VDIRESGESRGRLRVALVGLGWVGVNRHLRWLRRDPSVSLVGVVDRNPEKVERVRRQVHLARFAIATSAEEVGWLGDVDAVSIATSPATHHRLALSYLRAGKHVLMEKPLAMRPEEAEELCAEAVQRNLILAVVHNFQFSRSVRHALRLLDSGALGELRAVWGTQLSNPSRRLPSWYEELPLGLFYDESPHFFYLMRRILGENLSVTGVDVIAGRAGIRTPRSVGFRLLGGRVPARIEMNFDAPLSEWHLGIAGSDRLAVVDVFRDVTVVIRNDGSHSARQILRTSADAIGSHLWGVARSGYLLASHQLAYGNDEVIRRFVRACRSGSPPRRMAGTDGLAVVQLQHQVLAQAGIVDCGSS
jgi:scyllo-inositol 2-dehydrogenase (NADP+)